MRIGLSARLLALTMGTMLLTEIVLFIPGVTQSRRGWLNQHIRRAEIAGAATARVPTGLLDSAIQDDLLRLADARSIRLIRPTRTVAELAPDPAIVPHSAIDMRHETYLEGMWRALSALFVGGDGALEVTAVAPMQRSILIVEVVEESGLSAAVRLYTRRIAALWLTAMLVTGTLLYVVLLVVLVRPMRQLTRSITLFRHDPDHAAIAHRGSGEELATAAAELAAMQVELRNALWRNARLAALGTTLAKVSHDLRGILATALLTADRLTNHADPMVARAGDVLVTSVDRAALLVRQTLDFARDSPPPEQTRFSLHALISDAMKTFEAGERTCVDIDIDRCLQVEADREQMLRVVANLIRNAAEAGATEVTITATHAPPMLAIRLADNGPGLPDGVVAKLFRPFVDSPKPGGTGVGLAIVRDLMRAQGGDAQLVETSTSGTVFQLLLPWRDG
jgi:signal transduction histidine kinase